MENVNYYFMNWRPHLFIGIIVSLVFAVFMHQKFGWYQLTPMIIAQAILIIGISPLIPDLDHENGKLHQVLMGIGLTIAFVGLVYWLLFGKGFNLLSMTGWNNLIITGIILAFVTYTTAQVAHHRGFMHSILFCLLYSVSLYIIVGLSIQLALLGAIGCYSHLIADGIPLKTK